MVHANFEETCCNVITPADGFKLLRAQVSPTEKRGWERYFTMFQNLGTNSNGYLTIFSPWSSDQNMCNVKINSGEWEFDHSLTKKSSKSGYLSEMLGTIKDWK